MQWQALWQPSLCTLSSSGRDTDCVRSMWLGHFGRMVCRGVSVLFGESGTSGHGADCTCRTSCCRSSIQYAKHWQSYS